jgi:hypothetical protein
MNGKTSKSNYPKWTLWLLAVAVLLGIALRFAWTQDMEYKGDEQYMFARTQNVGVTESWPGIGMPSGVGLRNPGMSIWVLVALARVAQATTPLGVTQAVIFLNCLALLVFVFIVLKVVEPEEREGWTWAVILAAVNPVAIQLQRKIWAQSVLPIFCAIFLLCWFKRRKNTGAFFWGLVGAWLGQIHMSGFFFAAAVALWTAGREWKDRSTRIASAHSLVHSRWIAWFAGSFLGALTLIPWIGYVMSGQAGASKAPWSELLHLRFWSEWISQSMGFSVSYSLGHRTFQDFIEFPFIGDSPTYAMGIFHVVSAIAGVGLILLGLREIGIKGLKWKKDASDTSEIQNAGFFGFGALVNLGRVFVYRHYLIVSYPLQFLWLSRLGLRNVKFGRFLLVFLYVAQLAISVGFLSYIHIHGGAPEGDYGVAYSAQR